MSITIGEETVTITNELIISSVCLFDLDNSNGKRISINYTLQGEQRTINVEGQDYNDFYNSWMDGRDIINLIKSRESSLSELNVNIQIAEAQFLNT